MDAIQFCCPQGHKIKAKPELAGKLAKCPSCKSVMLVPERVKLLVKSREALTQSGVLRILGDAPKLPPMPEKSRAIKRICPRCSKTLTPALTVCTHCQLYVGRDTAPTSKTGDHEF